MKKHLGCILTLSIATLPTLHAAISLGDRILIDFGRDNLETSGNWNNVSNNGQRFNTSTTVALSGAGNLVRNSDNATTGVSLFFTDDSGNGDEIGIGGADNQAAANFSTFPESASRDTLFLAGNEAFAEFEIRGLNTALTYNLRFFGSVPSSNDRDNTTFNVDTDGNGSLDSTASYDAGEAAQNGETGVVFADFTGVASNNGVIRFRFQAPGAGAAGQLNVFELTAVPEPSSLALLAGGLGLLTLRRRR